jgi:putative component of membrane protein insertase Oxa1/YidC/SpoIIIJ protein YidD
MKLIKTFPFKKYTTCMGLCGILAFYNGEVWIVCFSVMMPCQWLPTVSRYHLQDISTFDNEAGDFA